MKTVSMSGSLRENVGKKDAKSLRKQGLVPCVVYGGKGEQAQIAGADGRAGEREDAGLHDPE